MVIDWATSEAGPVASIAAAMNRLGELPKAKPQAAAATYTSTGVPERTASTSTLTANRRVLPTTSLRRWWSMWAPTTTTLRTDVTPKANSTQPGLPGHAHVLQEVGDVGVNDVVGNHVRRQREQDRRGGPGSPEPAGP